MDGGAFSESDLKKFMLQVKLEMQAIASGVDMLRNGDRVIEWYNSAPHRLVKLLSYPLLKQLPSASLNVVASTVATDLTSKDDEIQLTAMKVMYLLPHSCALELIRTHAKVMLDIIKAPELNFERALLLHEFLLKAYYKHTENADNDSRELVIPFYLAFLEQVFLTNRDITRNAIDVLMSVYGEYISGHSKLSAAEGIFDGVGSARTCLKPLIVRLTNVLMTRLESLMSKICSYEVRLRSELIRFIVHILEVSVELSEENSGCEGLGLGLQSEFIDSNDSSLLLLPNRHSNGENSSLNVCVFLSTLLKKHLIQDILRATHEMQVLTNAYSCCFSLLFLVEKRPSLLAYHDRCYFVYALSLQFIDMCTKTAFKKEYNPLIMNLISLLGNANPTVKITVSMKILEIIIAANSHPFNRYFVMLTVFVNFISASVELISQGKSSCIFALFSQNWFLKVIKEVDEDQQEKQRESHVSAKVVKEEMVINLATAGLFALKYLRDERNSASLDKVILEVLDVCYRVISWKTASNDKKKTGGGAVASTTTTTTSSSSSAKREQENRALSFQIEAYLVLLEEALRVVSEEQMALRVSEIVERVNQTNEMNFLPKLKCVRVLLLLKANKRAAALDACVNQLNLRAVISDFKSFIVPAVIPPFFFEKYYENLMNLSEINTYLNTLGEVFVCLEMISTINTADSEVKAILMNLLEDFSKYLNNIAPAQRERIGLVETLLSAQEVLLVSILDGTGSVNAAAAKDGSNNGGNSNHKRTFEIARTFLENVDIAAVEVSKKARVSLDAKDLQGLSFEYFLGNVVLNRSAAISDALEAENSMKIISNIFVVKSARHSSQFRGGERAANAYHKMASAPVLISGLSDCVQIYASHGVNVAKQLLSVNLKLFNTTKMQINELRIKVLHSNGLSIFPSESNPKEIVLDEVAPFSITHMSFSLNVASIESHRVSFEVTIADNVFKTTLYRIELQDFIIPNRIVSLSSLFFENTYANLSTAFEVSASLTCPIAEFVKTIRNVQQNFSCVILEGTSISYEDLKDRGSHQAVHSHRSNGANKTTTTTAYSKNKNAKSAIGILGLTWDGVTVAIRVANIAENSERVSVECRASRNVIVGLIKDDQDRFFESIFAGSLALL